MNKVELTGRAGALFTQGARTMELDGELMASGDVWVLYSSSVGLWNDGNEASAADKQSIVQEVVDLLAKEGVRVVVE